jgi:hypothetical protein
MNKSQARQSRAFRSIPRFSTLLDDLVNPSRRLMGGKLVGEYREFFPASEL